MVHFSHGQQLTPEQLNSLGEFTIHRNAMLSQFLLGKEGIIDHYAQGLKLSLDKNDPMSLCVSPGAAINFMGQTVVLEEPELVSLRDLVVVEEGRVRVDRRVRPLVHDKVRRAADEVGVALGARRAGDAVARPQVLHHRRDAVGRGEHRFFE